MNKNVFGRKFKRDVNERKALFKSLMSSLVLYERIETTESKAKAIKSEVEKLVTKAKQGDNSAKSVLEKSLSKPAFDKILKEIGPRFSKRAGGYTRLIKLGRRFGDDAPVAILEWVETAQIVPVEKTEEKPKKKQESKTKSQKAPAKKEIKKPVKKTTTRKKITSKSK